MNFENRVGETERQGDSTVGRQGDADGGMKSLGEKIKDFFGRCERNSAGGGS